MCKHKKNINYFLTMTILWFGSMKTNLISSAAVI